jgi:hypothetical protein
MVGITPGLDMHEAVAINTTAWTKPMDRPETERIEGGGEDGLLSFQQVTGGDEFMTFHASSSSSSSGNDIGIAANSNTSKTGGPGTGADEEALLL